MWCLCTDFKPKIHLNGQHYDPSWISVRWKVWPGVSLLAVLTSVDMISLATILVVCLGWGLEGGRVMCVRHTKIWGACGGHNSLNNSSQRSPWTRCFWLNCSTSPFWAAWAERRADSEMCFCPGCWTADVHNSWEFDKELKAFPYLDKKQVTER